MNKKGFTLIELLAVIVVLSLIITIVATKGFGAFDNAKKGISSLNEKALKESFNLVKVEIEHCDNDTSTDLLVMFGVSTCEELKIELLDGKELSLNILKNNGFISDKDLEKLSESEKNSYTTIFYTNDEEKIKYAKSESTLLKRNDGSSTEKYYNYKTKIKEVKFVDYIDVSKAGTNKWDVNSTENPNIKAWLEEIDSSSSYYEEGETYYILYIGSESRIIAPENLSYFFRDFTVLEKIYFDNFSTINTKNMAYLFRNCPKLQELNLNNFNTKKVTAMNSMFYDLTSLEKLDLGNNFDTSSVTNMGYMFYNMTNLKQLNLGDKFNTINVKFMDNMFKNVGNKTHLNSLDLSQFKTDKIENKANMFNGAKINTLYLSGSNINVLSDGTGINSTDIPNIVIK